jgi:hypothetical protein
VQGDGPRVSLVEMLVDFERVDLAVEAGDERLVQRRQRLAGDVHHGTVHPCDGSDAPRAVPSGHGPAGRLVRHGA